MRIPKLAKKKIEDLHELKMELQHAIDSEDFEQAAELRDKIREIESKGK